MFPKIVSRTFQNSLRKMDTTIERKELAIAISLLEEAEVKASRGLCDSGTGSCSVHRAVVAAIPALHLCLRMLKRKQKSIGKNLG